MPTIKTVEFLSRYDAVRRTPEPGTIVISINDLHDSPAPLQAGWKAVHVLKYNSNERPTEGSFTMEMAQGILDFVREHEDTATKVLVHCMYGESRSAAVAIALDEKYSLGLDHSACAMHHTLTLYYLFDVMVEEGSF